MTARVLPTEPGWWWAQALGGVAHPVRIAEASGVMGRELVAEGRWSVHDPLWTWLEPIPAPGEVAVLRDELVALRDERNRLRAEREDALRKASELRSRLARLGAP